MYNRREVIKAGIGIVAAAVGRSAGADINLRQNGESSMTVSPRRKLNFNQDYRFSLGDNAGAESPEFDDHEWEYVCLPHCFSTPYWGGPKFYVGYGWYRKAFDIPGDWLGKALILEFEGAFQDAEVFINGKLAGHHLGGYTGFVVPISGLVKPGVNTLAVRLNNLWNPQLAPRAGEHQFAAGIYRNVWLNIVSAVHIPYNGVSITTSNISAASAVVAAKTTVLNGSDSAKSVTLLTELIDPSGQLMTKISTTRRIGAGQSFEFDQLCPAIPNPLLWHPDHPHLYSVRSNVTAANVVVDTLSTSIGLRWFSFSAESGFALNGEHYLIRGTNVHQDHAGWCNAVTNAGIVRDVRMVKDAGFNFIRGSHYPHPPSFYDACDRLGILVWSELCFWGLGGFSPDGYWNASAYPVNPDDQPGFEQSCKDMLVEMVTQHRNNPSVIVWSMCNEVFFSAASVMPNVRNLLTELVALCHEIDPARPAGIGGCQRGEIDKLGDIAGYNGDGARLFIDPGIPSLVSEYGSCGDARPGGFDGCFGDTAGQPDFPWRSGKALWCMFDHGSIASIGRLGCVDYFRIPKRRWFWYRQEYAGIAPPQWPQAGVAAGLKLSAISTTIHNDGTDDCQILVTVVDSSGTHISSSPDVTLTIESGPGQFPTGQTIPFKTGTAIDIRDGLAAIEFRSQYPGQATIRATSPGLRDGLISITVTGSVSARNPAQKALTTQLEGPVTAAAGPSPQTLAGVNLAANRPTLASSEASGHPASLANDGDLNTYWSAAAVDKSAWWQVDLENVYLVNQAKITFPEAGNFQYILQLSADQVHWTKAVDQQKSSDRSMTRTDIFPPSSIGRFLRITFFNLPPGTNAGLKELEVFGAPNVG